VFIALAANINNNAMGMGITQNDYRECVSGHFAKCCVQKYLSKQ